MIGCKRCGNSDRVIKYWIKAGKQLSQRWFYYNCRHFFNTPLLVERSLLYQNTDFIF